MPTYLKPTINGNCGKDKSFWGGRDVECTPTQPSSPITWAAEHGENALYMRSAPCPFPCQTCALVPCSGMSWRASHGAPYMIYRGREVQYSQTFRILGIVHALYIRTCTHRNSISLLYKYSTCWENMHLILYSYMMCLQYFTKLFLIKHLKTLDIITM